MKQKKTVEDYLKTIYILQRHGETARGADVAEKFGVSRPTVSIALKELGEEGYLFIDEGHGIHLIPAGKKIAKETYERHQTFQNLFQNSRKDSLTIEISLAEELLKQDGAFPRKSPLFHLYICGNRDLTVS